MVVPFHVLFSKGKPVLHFVHPDAPEQEEEFQNDKALMRNQLFSSLLKLLSKTTR